MLRIGVFAFPIGVVGQPTRYVADVIFNTNFDYPSKYCIFLGIMTRLVVNHQDTFKFLYPGTQITMGYA